MTVYEDVANDYLHWQNSIDVTIQRAKVGGDIKEETKAVRQDLSVARLAFQEVRLRGDQRIFLVANAPLSDIEEIKPDDELHEDLIDDIDGDTSSWIIEDVSTVKWGHEHICLCRLKR